MALVVPGVSRMVAVESAEDPFSTMGLRVVGCGQPEPVTSTPSPIRYR